MTNLPSPTGLFTENATQQTWLYLVYLILTGDLKTKSFTAITPTITGAGGMSVSSQVINVARYKVVGGLVFLELNVNFTLGGIASTDILFSVPLLPSYSGGGLGLITDSSQVTGLITYIGDNPVFTIKRFDGANWSLGSSRNITISMTYSTTGNY